MPQQIGDIPDQIEQPETPLPDERADIARRIETAEDFKPEQLREATEVSLPEVHGFESSGLMSD